MPSVDTQFVNATPPIFQNDAIELRQCRYGTMLYSTNDAYIGRSLQLYGEYCEDDVRLFHKVVKPGHTVLDIGANIGVHTVMLANAVGTSGRVIAIEPLRSNFHMLCANLVLNGFNHADAMRAAVGNAEGIVQVPRAGLTNAGNQGAFSLRDPLADKAEVEPVPITTIDALNLVACHFVKVDVEGMEDDVVRGGAATFARHRPFLYLENNRKDRSAGLIQSLFDLDYRCFWYPARYFNPDNYFGNDENVFRKDIELNMLAVPRIVAHMVDDMPEVTSPDDWPLRQDPVPNIPK